MSAKNPYPTSRLSAIVTRTTARIQGDQDCRIDVQWARTPDAAVTLVWGSILLRFTSANAAQGVLEGFAAARGHMLNVPRLAPPTGRNDVGYASPLIQLTWARRTPYAAVHRDMYSETQRRTLNWVELHMGPVMWQIVDREGYDNSIAILRDAHRTAAEVCLDGYWYRADPTKDDYLAPDPILEDYRNHLACEHYSPEMVMRSDGGVPFESLYDVESLDPADDSGPSAEG